MWTCLKMALTLRHKCIFSTKHWSALTVMLLCERQNHWLVCGGIILAPESTNNISGQISVSLPSREGCLCRSWWKYTTKQKSYVVSLQPCPSALCPWLAHCKDTAQSIADTGKQMIEGVVSLQLSCIALSSLQFPLFTEIWNLRLLYSNLCRQYFQLPIILFWSELESFTREHMSRRSNLLHCSFFFFNYVFLFLRYSWKGAMKDFI